MITFTKAFRTSDDFTHPTLEAAQQWELAQLVMGHSQTDPADAGRIAAAIMALKPAIMNILTTTTTSRPRARKANKQSKSMTAKMVAVVV